MDCNVQNRAAPGIRKRYLVLWAALVVLGVFVYSVLGFFRLSSETAALRASLSNAFHGEIDKKIAVNAGAITLGLVRTGMRFVKLPPEPRAALDAMRSAEVGVYSFGANAGQPDKSKILTAADKAMKSRGWTRMVAVVQDQDLVMVYVPKKGLSAKKMSCCLLVLHEQFLVVGAARCNPTPLMQLASKQLNHLGRTPGAAAGTAATPDCSS
jgi:hypothetical protein